VWAVRERDEERERVGGGGECCLVWAGWHRARADLRRARGGRPLLSLSSLEAHLRLHFSPARSIPRAVPLLLAQRPPASGPVGLPPESPRTL
jgi:hypothetical protein